jgi:hypothetical protein
METGLKSALMGLLPVNTGGDKVLSRPVGSTGIIAPFSGPLRDQDIKGGSIIVASLPFKFLY